MLASTLGESTQLLSVSSRTFAKKDECDGGGDTMAKCIQDGFNSSLYNLINLGPSAAGTATPLAKLDDEE